MQRHEELLIALRRVIRAIHLYSRKLNKESGLTGPQLLILLQIDKTTGIKASQIAKNINLSAATVTNILDRLESRGLIQRVRGDVDKRSYALFLTESAKSLLLEAPQPLQEHFIRNFCMLKDWEQSQLLSSMQHIASMMDASDLDASPLLEIAPMPSIKRDD